MKTSKPVGHVTWHTPGRNQGQTIDVAYGVDDDGNRWERTHDRADGSTTYRSLGHASDGGTWEPWQTVPACAR